MIEIFVYGSYENNKPYFRLRDELMETPVTEDPKHLTKLGFRVSSQTTNVPNLYLKEIIVGYKSMGEFRLSFEDDYPEYFI